MGRTSDAERAEHAHLAPAQPKPAKDLVLAACEEGTDPAQSRGDTQGVQLEVRARRSPTIKDPIRDVFSHAGIVPQENY